MKEIKKEIFKPLLVKILQWFYLLLAVFFISVPFWLNNLKSYQTLNIPNDFVIGIAIVLAIFSALLSVSFFTENSSLLILSMVLIFFIFIGAGILLVIGILNAKPLWSGGIPVCYKNLNTCHLQDGLTILSAFSLAVSIPILILNLITLVGAVKAIAAND